MKIIWFRNDLRVRDNPALSQACQDTKKPLLGVYFLCQKQWQHHQVGANQQALICSALQNLKVELSRLNVPLLILDAQEFDVIAKQLQKLIEQLGVTDIFFNIEYPLNERRRDQQLYESFKQRVNFHRYIGDSLVPPWEIV